MEHEPVFRAHLYRVPFWSGGPASLWSIWFNTIKNGFGGTLGSIGIVILCGTIIGFIMEKTGAALSITQAILKLVGNNRAPLANEYCRLHRFRTGFL